MNETKNVKKSIELAFSSGNSDAVLAHARNAPLPKWLRADPGWKWGRSRDPLTTVSFAKEDGFGLLSESLDDDC